ncbi:hypothetical protein [Rhizorhapis sp. SPR117]|uniref:hypothetical protein n=1 Tax=Rhizorhapis sp. SPR117 TaxID=2912611 RepID=UPI001F458D7E|nr:hypothetical protein [Rhizorhapis sp. SPR117]
MKSYIEALRKRAISAGGSSPTNKVLLDLRECSIQSQTVLDSMLQIIENYAAQIEHYGMLLPESALLRLQMKRLMSIASTSFFANDEEAAKWLTS